VRLQKQPTTQEATQAKYILIEREKVGIGKEADIYFVNLLVS
jgi:hypothetical protein